MSILAKRAERRERLNEQGDDSGSAMTFNTQNNLGDPNQYHPKYLIEGITVPNPVNCTRLAKTKMG